MRLSLKAKPERLGQIESEKFAGEAVKGWNQSARLK